IKSKLKNNPIRLEGMSAKSKQSNIKIVEGGKKDQSAAGSSKKRKEKTTNYTEENAKRKKVVVSGLLEHNENVKTGDLNQKEYAGSYTSLPHTHKPGDDDHISSATFQLAITELLEELCLENEEKIVVTLVPRKVGERLAIGCVEIMLVDC
ncbi:hypothetical protein AABB24_014438, partial [Solanum stoloniferum]